MRNTGPLDHVDPGDSQLGADETRRVVIQSHSLGDTRPPIVAAIGGWRRSNNSAKYRSEIALIAEAYFLADACYSVVCVCQENLGAFNSIVIEILHERQPRDL